MIGREVIERIKQLDAESKEIHYRDQRDGELLESSFIDVDEKTGNVVID